MALVVPLVGDLLAIDDLAAARVYTYHLYNTDVAIGPATVLGDFAASTPTFPGYAPEVAGPWDPAAIVAGRAVAQAPLLVYTRSAGVGAADNIYGYFVLDENGDLRFCERGAAPPYIIAVTGDYIALIPIMTGKSEF